MHADAQIVSYGDYGLDSTFVCFKPFTTKIQLCIVKCFNTDAEITKESDTKGWRYAECFSIQIDKYSIDNKFITARYLDNSKNVFLRESHYSKRGAGLLDSITITLRNLNLKDIAKQTTTELMMVWALTLIRTVFVE